MEIPGDRDATLWDDFYATYRRLVYATAYRVLRNSFDAEDVVQAVFIKAWKRPARFAEGKLESWLAVASRNAALDIVRKKVRFLPYDDALEAGNSNDTDVEAAVIFLSQKDWLEQRIRTLSCADRNLLRESFLARKSHRSIAISTNVPLGTVKSRIRTLLIRLRRDAGNLDVARRERPRVPRTPTSAAS
jgi:RNA polymerase sigma factor (sigma-70 family)